MDFLPLTDENTRIYLGKHHPDLNSAISEFKEQDFTEACVMERELDKRVKALWRRKWVKLQETIQVITASLHNDLFVWAMICHSSRIKARLTSHDIWEIVFLRT